MRIHNHAQHFGESHAKTKVQRQNSGDLWFSALTPDNSACVNKLFGIAPTFRYRTWHFSLFGTAPTFRYRTWHFSVSRPLFGITRGTFRYRMWRFSVSHRDHILNAASPGGHAAVQFRHSVFRSRSGVKPSPVLVRSGVGPVTNPGVAGWGSKVPSTGRKPGI